MIERVGEDVRLACRSLAHAKSFTATAVLTLALGIAATTTMFALIQGVLLRPLPVHEQDRLILAWKELRGSSSVQYPFGNTEIDAVARASRLLAAAAGVTRNGAGRTALLDGGVSSEANVAEVTGGFFGVLGVDAVIGRALAPADDKDGAEHTIVLSHGFWRRRYGASPAVIGRRVILDDRPFTILGVMPPDLDYPPGVEVWRTTTSVPADGRFGDAARREVNLVGRLHAGVTLDQAASEIGALSERIDAAAPANAVRGLIPVVRPFSDVIVGPVRAAMLALFAAVGLVLLIAAANVANLLLMRGEARQTELAVRAALGAGRAAILGPVLIESLLLALLAGVAGVAISWWSLDVLLTLIPDGLPRVESVRIDAAVLGFSIAVVLMTASFAGIPPALLALRADLASRLRSGGRGVTASASRGRRALVALQVALAVTVVAAAGLLIRSALRLQAVDLGMPADRLVLVELHVPQAQLANSRQHARLLDEIIAALEAAPAIAAATPVNLSPFSAQGWDLPQYTVEGQTAAEIAANPSLNIESIHPNYFTTLGVPIVRGRAFSAADREGRAPVAIVSQDVAERAWPGGDAIGKRFKMGNQASREPWYTVVGVAAPTRYRELANPRPTLYLPAAQFQMTATMLVLRTSAPLELVVTLARDRVRRVDRGVQVMRVAPFRTILGGPLARPRFNAFLLSIFAVSALLLSMIGLYAVMAAYVHQRDREIAVRLALGATGARVRRFVLGEAMKLAGAGSLAGLAGAVIAGRVLRGVLFEVDPLDPRHIAGAAFVLLLASYLVCYVPARRATRVDASATLRGE